MWCAQSLDLFILLCHQLFLWSFASHFSSPSFGFIIQAGVSYGLSVAHNAVCLFPGLPWQSQSKSRSHGSIPLVLMTHVFPLNLHHWDRLAHPNSRWTQKLCADISMFGLHWWLSSKEFACSAGDVGLLDWKNRLEEEIATYSSILAWEIPWTEESGGLQSMGLQSWTRLSTHIQVPI